jgi:hypothetical protein
VHIIEFDGMSRGKGGAGVQSWHLSPEGGRALFARRKAPLLFASKERGGARMGGEMDRDLDRELAEWEESFRFHRRLEAEAEARDITAEREHAESFRDFLLDLPRGLVVGIVTTDGAEIWGCIDAVGADKLRVAEASREVSPTDRLRPRRVHDVRLEAVVRVVRDAEEWGR